MVSLWYRKYRQIEVDIAITYRDRDIKHYIGITGKCVLLSGTEYSYAYPSLFDSLFHVFSQKQIRQLLFIPLGLY